MVATLDATAGEDGDGFLSAEELAVIAQRIADQAGAGYLGQAQQAVAADENRQQQRSLQQRAEAIAMRRLSEAGCYRRIEERRAAGLVGWGEVADAKGGQITKS